LFGGTFDPVHVGHVHAAEAVCDALGLTEIRLVLSARPSHRGVTLATLEDRWQMLCLACEGHPRLVPDDREVRRTRPSYTVETLEEIRAEHPRQSLAWVVGSDAFALLPSWYRWRDVLRLANLVVLKRPGHPLELNREMTALTETRRVDSLTDCHEGGILILDDVMVDVAAANIRRTIAAGGTVAHLLPESVANYIRQHGLYRGRKRVESVKTNSRKGTDHSTDR
jgi:nicotinate-nucleotide adenylyltransferase